MKLQRRLRGTVVFLVVGFVATVAMVLATGQAPSKAQGAPAKAKAALVKLPAAVAAAFKKSYPNATIKNVSHETEDGVEQYEIESTNAGRGLDVNYKPDGTPIVIEEEVAASDVPAAVTSAITARYPRATVTSRERATEKNRSYFEIGLKGASVKEVQLTPEGTWISPKAAK